MKKIPKNLESLLSYEIDPAFRERARIIFEEVIKITPKKILDAGCGRGFYLNALTHLPFVKKIYGIDINPNYLQIAKKNINKNKKKVLIKQADIYKLPFPNEFFDFIIASEILEHLKNDLKALLEIKRVLKKNGTLIITVPNYYFPFFWDPLNWFLMRLFKTHINKNIWWLAGIWADHERLYKSEEIKKIVIKSGLRIKTVNHIVRFCLPFSHFLIYGLGKNLVEKLNLQSFNRYNFKKRTLLVKIIASIFFLPHAMTKKMKENPFGSVNIILMAKK